LLQEGVIPSSLEKKAVKKIEKDIKKKRKKQRERKKERKEEENSEREPWLHTLKNQEATPLPFQAFICSIQIGTCSHA
jgi:hypothetical protein